MRDIPHSSVTGVGTVVDVRCMSESSLNRVRCELSTRHDGSHTAHHWFSQLPVYWPNEEKKS